MAHPRNPNTTYPPPPTVPTTSSLRIGPRRTGSSPRPESPAPISLSSISTFTSINSTGTSTNTTTSPISPTSPVLPHTLSSSAPASPVIPRALFPPRVPVAVTLNSPGGHIFPLLAPGSGDMPASGPIGGMGSREREWERGVRKKSNNLVSGLRRALSTSVVNNGGGGGKGRRGGRDGRDGRDGKARKMERVASTGQLQVRLQQELELEQERERDRPYIWSRSGSGWSGSRGSEDLVPLARGGELEYLRAQKSAKSSGSGGDQLQADSSSTSSRNPASASEGEVLPAKLQHISHTRLLAQGAFPNTLSWTNRQDTVPSQTPPRGGTGAHRKGKSLTSTTTGTSWPWFRGRCSGNVEKGGKDKDRDKDKDKDKDKEKAPNHRDYPQPKRRDGLFFSSSSSSRSSRDDSAARPGSGAGAGGAAVRPAGAAQAGQLPDLRRGTSLKAPPKPRFALRKTSLPESELLQPASLSLGPVPNPPPPPPPAPPWNIKSPAAGAANTVTPGPPATETYWAKALAALALTDVWSNAAAARWNLKGAGGSSYSFSTGSGSGSGSGSMASGSATSTSLLGMALGPGVGVGGSHTSRLGQQFAGGDGDGDGDGDGEVAVEDDDDDEDETPPAAELDLEGSALSVQEQWSSSSSSSSSGDEYGGSEDVQFGGLAPRPPDRPRVVGTGTGTGAGDGRAGGI